MQASHYYIQDNDPLVGTKLDDKYSIEKVLGQGTTGTVYLARESKGRRVAIKVLAPLQRNALGRARFKREAKAARRIKHPNVVRVYRLGETSDHIMYLVMEYVEGSTLRDHLLGPMPVAEAKSILLPIMSGLEAAHDAGVIHRDLKPDNVMLTSGTNIPKLLDLSVAKLDRPPEADSEGTTAPLTKANEALGTYVYMPPEQWTNENVDPRADIYSLGCMFHEMVAGERPFSGTIQELREAHRSAIPTPLHELVPNVPLEFSDAITWALAKNPNHRPQTISEFRCALEGKIDADLTDTVEDHPNVTVAFDVSVQDGRKHATVSITQIEPGKSFSLSDRLREEGKKSPKVAKHLKAVEAILKDDYLRGCRRKITVSLEDGRLRLNSYPWLVFADSRGTLHQNGIVVDSDNSSAKCEYWPDANRAGGKRFVIELIFGSPFRLQLVEKDRPSALILDFILTFETSTWQLATAQSGRHLFAS
jgi:serine/threonine protein kinase